MYNSKINSCLRKTLGNIHILFIWTIAILFYVYEFWLQVSTSVITSELMFAFQVNAQMIGSLTACFFAAYCIMQLPAGVLMDIYGPRKVLVLAVCICAFGAYIFGIANDFRIAELGRVCIGMGGAFAAIGCLKLTVNWFSASMFPLMSGLILSFGMIGAIFGQAPFAYLVDMHGWRNIMVYGSYVGFLLSICIVVIVRDKPNYNRTNHANPHYRKPSFFDLIQVLKNKHNWLLAWYSGFAFSTVPAFCGLWGVQYLAIAYDVSIASAGWLISLTFLGIALGAPVLGSLANKLQRRKPPMYVGIIVSIVSFSIIVYFPYKLPFNILATLLFIFGFAQSSFLGAFAIMRETNGSQHSATALSFINMINMVAGAMAQPIIGYILDLGWSSQSHSNVHNFTIEAYQISFLILLLFLILSLLMLFWIKESFCIDTYTIK